MRRRSRVGAGGRRQLRPQPPRRRVLDAAPGGAHRHGPAGRTRAARESLQGRVRCGELPGVHTDPGARHRHRPARLGADAERAAAPGQLLAAGRARGAPASNGGGHHLLPFRLARPCLFRGAAQAARGPDRPARLQPAERIDGRQARPRDDHREPPPIRARFRAPGSGAGRYPGGAWSLPAAPGGAVSLRRGRGAGRAIRPEPAPRPRTAQLRGPGCRRIAGVSAGLAGLRRRRDGPRGAPRPCRGVCRQPRRRGDATPTAPPLGAGSDPAPQSAAREPGNPRPRGRIPLPSLRPSREAPQGNEPPVAKPGGGTRRREHVQCARRRRVPARIRSGDRSGGRMGGDPVLAYGSDGLQPPAVTRDRPSRVRSRQPHLREWPSLRGADAFTGMSSRSTPRCPGTKCPRNARR